MSRGTQTFKQGDVTKAVKGVVKAGVKVDRVELENGKIIVFAGDSDANGTEARSNEWDAVK